MKRVIVMLFFLQAMIPCLANTYYVDANGTGDYATVQAAVNAAVNGDTIVLQPGTYTGAGNRDVNFIGKAITIRGATGEPNDCIIDCQGTQTDRHRGFKFVSGEGISSILEGVTITNGYAPSEAFFVPGSGTWIYGPGGAILCSNSGPYITNCIIRSNKAYNCAGGIYNYQSGTIIKNCIFNSNLNTEAGAWGGAGIFNEDSNITLNNCSFFANSTTQPGGGIYNTDSTVDINNCEFNGNTAELCGGGVCNSGGNVSIRNSYFSGNSMAVSSRGGGGIANMLSSNVTITNCTFATNNGYDGGAVWNNRCSIKLKDCTFIGNTGRNYGGGFL
jgi:hypothetical protein